MYMLYFVPKRVIEEYQAKIGDGEMLTTPIIKRRLSAMIYATMSTREQIAPGLFRHRFGKVEMLVEEQAKTVNRVNYILPREVPQNIGCIYGKICKYYGLNTSRHDFRPDCKAREC